MVFAIRGFQEKHYLKVDGKVGPPTWSEIQEGDRK